MLKPYFCIDIVIVQILSALSTGCRSVANCVGLFVAEIDIEKCVQDSIKIFCSTPKSATFRQHAWSQKSATPRKAVHSYYTQDYHEAPKTELVSFTVALSDGHWHWRACIKGAESQEAVGEERMASVGDFPWSLSVLQAHSML